jgi:HD-GYP domain-containing protein (c-di-GMP phosphodiesterase class II)
VPDAHPTLKLVAGQVHEQIDGTGYPRGIPLERIHPQSRVLNLADAYLSLTEPLAGRPSIVPYDAMALLLHHVSLGRFDATVMRGLLQSVSLFPLGSWVELSDLTPARVLRSTHEHYDRPIVEVLDGGSIQIIDLTRSDRFVTRPLLDPNHNQIRVPADSTAEPLWMPISSAA